MAKKSGETLEVRLVTRTISEMEPRSIDRPNTMQTRVLHSNKATNCMLHNKIMWKVHIVTARVHRATSYHQTFLEMVGEKV